MQRRDGETDQDFLDRLLDQGLLPTREPVERERRSQPRQNGRPSPARKRGGQGILRSLGDSISALLVFAGAAAFWYVGAFFTLLALETIGVPLASLGAWKWVIPGAVSVLQLCWWPGNNQGGRVWYFSVVSFFDGTSTLYGLILWGAGKFLPLASGFTLPSEGLALWIPAVIVAGGITFGPEQATVWVYNDLRRTWRV